VTIWLIASEAAAFLAARGITVVSREGCKPPDRDTVTAWARRGVLRQVRRVGSDRYGIWQFDQAELESFVPPVMGRPLAADPTPATAARRPKRLKQRERTPDGPTHG
jgi:hypothetical protein